MIDGMKAKNTTLAKCRRHILIGVAYVAILSVAGIAHAENGVGTAPEPTPEPTQVEAVYDPTQPGADDPRVKAGFEAYKAGDFKRAYDIWLPLADAGNAEAQYRIGRLYDFGEGQETDRELAFKWYEAAADQRHVIASYNLGVMYDIGDYIEKDEEKAEQYYFFAAERGHVSAQQNLGIFYILLPPGRRDFAESYKWLLLSEYNGNPEASGLIDKLDRFATPYDKEVGRERMREWLYRHSRLR